MRGFGGGPSACSPGRRLSRDATLPAFLPQVSLTFLVVSLPDGGRGDVMGLRPLRSPLPTPRSTPLGSQLAAFRIRSAFGKSRRLGSGRLAILRLARKMRTDAQRVLRKFCFRGKSFGKSPAGNEAFAPWAGGARKPEVQRSMKAGNAFRSKLPQATGGVFLNAR